MTGGEMIVLIVALSLIAGTQALLVARAVTRLEHTVAALDARLQAIERSYKAHKSAVEQAFRAHAAIGRIKDEI